MKKTAGLLSICGAMLLAPHTAHSRCALSDSDRLQLWCAIERGDEGMIDAQEGMAFGSALVREGYTAGARAGFRPTFYVSPVVEYSENVNGGNPNGPLILGRLQLHGDESRNKEEGWLVGGLLGLQGREFYGPGRYLEFSTGTSLLLAPAHDASSGSLFAGGCSRNHLANWWYADACYSIATTHKELSEEDSQMLSFELSKAFTSFGSVHHLASAGAREILKREVSQTRLFGELQTIHGDAVTTFVSAELGEEVGGGYLSLRSRFAAGASTQWEERDISIDLSAESYKGGQVLGHPREDTRWEFGVSLDITHSVEVSVGFGRTNSSIDYFDSEAPVIHLRISPYVF